MSEQRPLEPRPPQQPSPLAKIDADALEAGMVGLLAKAMKGAPGAEGTEATPPNFGVIGALTDLFDRVRDSRASAAHVAAMQARESDPNSFCEYIGTLGETETGLAIFLEREPTELEVAYFRRGQRARVLEVRALELARAHQGNGRIEPWMKR